ncbi:MAG TPA: RNA polymerase sigma factor [Povalibacter sp.]|jgi:RNA polymerase sigma-70 factor (ECF subfamily)|nr:RNA polymerase sigma factor [Povalibacter sp.]
MSQFQGIQVSPDTIRAAVAGDAAAHEIIYRTCARPVYAVIRRLIPNIATADDVFQDVFVEVLRNIGSYSGTGAFGGWVRTIAVNKCLMHLRSPWHRGMLWLDADSERTADGSGQFDPVDPAPLPETQMAAADLERALATLPALTRSIVWLHDVEGYKHHEIAQLMGRSIGFSKSQLARAHVRLRRLLDSDPPQPAGGSLPCTPVSTSC